MPSSEHLGADNDGLATGCDEQRVARLLLGFAFNSFSC